MNVWARAEPPIVVIGRLELMWRRGSWCRPDEWIFGRQECDVGCIVLDVGFFVVSWYRGVHAYPGYRGVAAQNRRRRAPAERISRP